MSLQVGNLLKRALDAEAKVAAAAHALKEAERQLRQVVEVDLPNAMAEEGLTTFSTDDYKVDVKDELYAHISAEKKPLAADWLREHGHGDLVRPSCFADLTETRHGGDPTKVVNALHRMGINAEVGVDMNTSRIKALVKELMEEGQSVPLDLFGIHQRRAAVIKPVKKKGATPR